MNDVVKIIDISWKRFRDVMFSKGQIIILLQFCQPSRNATNIVVVYGEANAFRVSLFFVPIENRLNEIIAKETCPSCYEEVFATEAGKFLI